MYLLQCGNLNHDPSPKRSLAKPIPCLLHCKREKVCVYITLLGVFEGEVTSDGRAARLSPSRSVLWDGMQLKAIYSLS